MNARKIAMIASMGVAGLCLIGAGAGATFTDATNSVQTITSGTLNMQLSAPDDPNATTSSDGKTVTLESASPVGSTFKTAPVSFEILNAGTITANEILIKGSETDGGKAADQALLGQMNVCIYSPYIDSTNPGGVVFDGRVSTFDASGQQVEGPVAPGGKDHYTAEFYAGDVTTACGAETSPSLDNSAQGGTVTPTVTLSYTG